MTFRSETNNNHQESNQLLDYDIETFQIIISLKEIYQGLRSKHQDIVKLLKQYEIDYKN